MKTTRLSTNHELHDQSVHSTNAFLRTAQRARMGSLKTQRLRKAPSTMVFTALVAMLSLAIATGAGASPQFKTRNGHLALIVDGRPTVILGAHLQEDTAYNATTITISEYLQTARDLGLNAIRVPVRWGTWAHEDFTRDYFLAVDPTREDLNNIVATAKSLGLRIQLAWMGSNVGGKTNQAPSEIYDLSGTFHPQGDFPPPDPFDYANAPATYGNYILVTDENGDIAAQGSDPNNNFGVYCPSWPNLIEQEKTALESLANWIQSVNSTPPRDTIISLQIENELVLVNKEANQRCRCSLCDYLFDHPSTLQSGFDWSWPTFESFLPGFLARHPELDATEAFNQWTMQRYFRELALRVKTVITGFPIIVNVWGESFPGCPYKDLGVADEGTGWIGQSDADIIGPDMYSIDNWVFDPDYAIDENVLFVPEFGAHDYPHFQIFGFFGSNKATSGPAYIGLGYSTYALYGDLISDFVGMVSDGVARPFLPNPPPEGQWLENNIFHLYYHAAFYQRASNAAITAASEPIAVYEGTGSLIGFFDQVYKYPDNFSSGGLYTVGQLPVRLTDLGSAQAPARGVIVNTGGRDLTLVGANYQARVEYNFNGHQVNAERGYWSGGRWYKSADCLPGTCTIDSQTGYCSVTLSADNKTDQGPLTVGLGGPLDLQYAVRIWEPSTVPDWDHDGVIDGLDNCKTKSNADQADSDGDGIGDVCDGVCGTLPGAGKGSGWQNYGSLLIPFLAVWLFAVLVRRVQAGRRSH